MPNDEHAIDTAFYDQSYGKVLCEEKVISRTLSGTHSFTYKKIVKRMRSLASALESLGIEKGDRVGTFAWNHHRHLEAYFAVPSMGAVLHTINIRLSEEHLIYIINHAADKILLIDPDLLPLIERIQDRLQTVEAFVVMTDEAFLPESKLTSLYSYEALVQDADPTYEFREDLDENDPAGLCYTSATTGKPKGVLYTHRGIYLHSMALGMANTVGLSEADIAMPVVPMFHVNAWGYLCSSLAWCASSAARTFAYTANISVSNRRKPSVNNGRSSYNLARFIKST